MREPVLQIAEVYFNNCLLMATAAVGLAGLDFGGFPAPDAVITRTLLVPVRMMNQSAWRDIAWLCE